MEAALIVGLTLLAVVVAVGGWLLFVLVRQHGQALLGLRELGDRLEVIQDELAELIESAAAAPRGGEGQGQARQSPQGLSVGSPAPQFTLPDLKGTPRRLSELKGKQLVLVSFDTHCGFCRKMAPMLGELPDDAPPVVLLARGEPDELHKMAGDHGWTATVLLDTDGEVGRKFRAGATPTGYLIDQQGRIASPFTIGADALLDLLAASANGRGGGNANGNGELTAASLREKERAAAGRARKAGVKVRDVKDSRLKRDGLAPGTPAPTFEQPDLTGATRSLSEFRGKDVLLVFSDPKCGPCQSLAPQLEEVHRSRHDLHVVMVSRGDPDANRAKATQHGLSFPVLLQTHWEVSRDYALFATPVAYLIDADGVIAKEPAIGADAIRALI